MGRRAHTLTSRFDSWTRQGEELTWRYHATEHRDANADYAKPRGNLGAGGGTARRHDRASGNGDFGFSRKAAPRCFCGSRKCGGFL